MSGLDCVIRDCQGLVICVVASPLGHEDSTRVEVMGLFIGLHELRNIGASHGCVEGDLKVVIGWGVGSCNGFWIYAHFIHEIRDLVASLNISLSYVLRSHNFLADRIAKWGVGLDDIYVSSVMPDIPN